MPQDGDVTVAVVGGGIAGLTTALRLAQRGYKVTLYEEKPFLGGNLSAHRCEGSDVFVDVYPHMFSNFYVNFWDIMENDLGLRRDQSAQSDFATRSSFKFIRPGTQRYMAIKDAGELKNLWPNMLSGVVPPWDMYLWTFSMLDMLAHSFNPRRDLTDYSVSGFVQSRAYATEATVDMNDYIIMLIWSVHGIDTSAASYRSFLHQTFAHLNPLVWLLKGDLQQKIMDPLQQKLEALGCKIRLNTRVAQVQVDGSKVSGLKVQETTYFWDKHQTNPRHHDEQLLEPEDPHPDFVVLAVPPSALGNLVVSGDPGHRIVDRVPVLSEVRRLNSEPIPVLNLYFTRKLQDIPPENTAMLESRADLSFLDISQLWDNPDLKGITAMTVSVSDYWALPGDDPKENAFTMIRLLHDYLPQFDPGTQWGESPDIDWKRTHYQSNQSDLLFINQVGSQDYRPNTHYPALYNLFFAGDLVNNRIDMATVEAAVTSGLHAARGIQKAQPLGSPIKVLHEETKSETYILGLKLWMAPAAYWCKWLTGAQDALNDLANGRVRKASADLSGMCGLPYAYANDWMRTTGAFWRSVLMKRPGS